MATFIAFMRAINVGGRFIKMELLAQHFRSIGFEDATTFISSGNVIFSSRVRSATKLASTIEAELEPLLGYKSEVFIRTPAELQLIATKGAVLLSSVPVGGDVNVAFLAAALSDVQRHIVSSFCNASDQFECGETEVYWVSQNKQSESKFSNVVFERQLKTRTTFRRATMLSRLVEKVLV